jgi:hypothetical protein
LSDEPRPACMKPPVVRSFSVSYYVNFHKMSNST